MYNTDQTYSLHWSDVFIKFKEQTWLVHSWRTTTMKQRLQSKWDCWNVSLLSLKTIQQGMALHGSCHRDSLHLKLNVQRAVIIQGPLRPRWQFGLSEINFRLAETMDPHCHSWTHGKVLLQLNSSQLLHCGSDVPFRPNLFADSLKL